jgi:hypothetical protein
LTRPLPIISPILESTSKLLSSNLMENSGATHRK